MPRLVATLGGLGLVPVAPGTVASLVAVVAYFLFYQINPYVPLLLLFFLIPVAVWGSGKYEASTGRQDPPEIVVDEWVGQFICFIGVEPSLSALAAGFFLFRIFDIIKLPPVRRLEELPNGVGVVADDVAAGILGWVILSGLSYLEVV
ncbi:MAG: phosphatidylglycerophosphatase A [Nitrospinae bacterium]|nr:phosphatidylglycerophosphatase A [Nitrospinota bacterium]